MKKLLLIISLVIVLFMLISIRKGHEKEVQLEQKEIGSVLNRGEKLGDKLDLTKVNRGQPERESKELEKEEVNDQLIKRAKKLLGDDFSIPDDVEPIVYKEKNVIIVGWPVKFVDDIPIPSSDYYVRVAFNPDSLKPIQIIGSY